MATQPSLNDDVRRGRVPCRVGILPWPWSCAHVAIPDGYGRGTSRTARRRHTVACSPRLFRTYMCLEYDALALSAPPVGGRPCRFGHNALAVGVDPPCAVTTSRFEPAARAGTLRGAVARAHHGAEPNRRGRRRRKRPGTRVFVGLCMKMAENDAYFIFAYGAENGSVVCALVRRVCHSVLESSRSDVDAGEAATFSDLPADVRSPDLIARRGRRHGRLGNLSGYRV